LDTWFSSALWPFTVFGWPKRTRDFKTYFPTDVLSTARDIINLWVARMIFCSLKLTKKIPFRYVFIHPTVLTKKGERMSKSLGTGIDPLDLVKEYGADAVRFGLVWQVKGSQDLKFDENFCKMGRKFCNKIWNASRFVLIKIGKKEFKNRKIKELEGKTKADKEIIKKIKRDDKTNRPIFKEFRIWKSS
jgi:valyl-tRNA synthetase